MRFRFALCLLATPSVLAAQAQRARVPDAVTYELLVTPNVRDSAPSWITLAGSHRAISVLAGTVEVVDDSIVRVSTPARLRITPSADGLALGDDRGDTVRVSVRPLLRDGAEAVAEGVIVWIGPTGPDGRRRVTGDHTLAKDSPARWSSSDLELAHTLDEISRRALARATRAVSP